MSVSWREKMHLLIVRTTPAEVGVSPADVRSINEDIQAINQIPLGLGSLSAKIANREASVANGRQVTANSDRVNEIAQCRSLGHWLAAGECQPLDFLKPRYFLGESSYVDGMAAGERQSLGSDASRAT
jgi:hypothetical protein